MVTVAGIWIHVLGKIWGNSKGQLLALPRKTATLDSNLQLPSVKNENKTAAWAASWVLRGVPCSRESMLYPWGKRRGMLFKEKAPKAVQSLGGSRCFFQSEWKNLP